MNLAFRKKTKFPEAVMVWGGIGLGYRTPLMVCSAGVDSTEYTRILTQSDLLCEMNAKYGESQWTLMQDGAPCHTSRQTMQWASQKHLCILPGWPPNSPDLNPIEQVWGIMKTQLRRLSKRGQLTKKEMFEQLQATWDAMSEECINSLVSSFTDRCKMVLALGGKSASPYLSSHQTVADDNDDRQDLVRDADFSERLLALVKEIGTKWTRVGAALGCEPNLAKHRYQLLLRARVNSDLRKRLKLPSISVLGLDEADLQPFVTDEWLSTFDS